MLSELLSCHVEQLFQNGFLPSFVSEVIGTGKSICFFSMGINFGFGEAHRQNPSFE